MYVIQKSKEWTRNIFFWLAELNIYFCFNQAKRMCFFTLLILLMYISGLLVCETAVLRKSDNNVYSGAPGISGEQVQTEFHTVSYSLCLVIKQ